jgi:secreted PhoX family phosphatase
MTLSRRNFLTLAGISAGTAILASPLKNLYARTIAGESIVGKGFGPLIPDPNGILDLPKGFRYKAISQAGTIMSDGNPVPTKQDGMATFAGSNGTTILIRNHELNPDDIPGVVAPDAKKYDKLSQGGTTTLIVDRDRNLIKEFVSLAGTNRNCAGGTTPWNAWISSEEDVATPATNSSGNPKNVSAKHGYNFEVPASEGIANPVPLVAMGRFRHEAIVVDPNTGYVYQTEDREDSCIYRFRPHQSGNLKAGGILEALVIKDLPKVNTTLNFPVGKPKPVAWVVIEEVDPQDDTVRYEAQSKGAAIFRRGEGMCYGNGEIYWTCTDGGQAKAGQVFRYNPVRNAVELFVESPGAEVLDFPDNLILTPFGDLMVCEDGTGEQFMVGITPQGECYHFARNALNQSEFAGVCFSPDGQTMFVNIYQPGMTLAVWGPWHQV